MEYLEGANARRQSGEGDVYVNICFMKRTTIYLEPELEVLLKLETQRRGKSMAELIREALRSHLRAGTGKHPPGGGAFASGRRDTASKLDERLEKLGFGKDR
jgi:hypothetical protein